MEIHSLRRQLHDARHAAAASQVQTLEKMGHLMVIACYSNIAGSWFGTFFIYFYFPQELK
jgi:hypothetical protein